MYGETPHNLLDPRYRDALHTLEQQFNSWSEAERQALYRPAVIDTFQLTDT